RAGLEGPVPSTGRYAEASALLLFLDLALDRGALRGDLARRLRRRRRVFVAHALLEALHGSAEVLADVAKLLGAEDEQHDHEHDQPMPDAEGTHRNLLVKRAARLTSPAAASCGRRAGDRRGCVYANDTRPGVRSARCSRWCGNL